MDMPFTTEQFLNVFKQYNEAVFPAQIILNLLAFFGFYLIVRSFSRSGRILSVLLAFFWLWMAVVYHLLFFASINKGAYIFAGLFTAEALLFLILGVFKSLLNFSFRLDVYGITGFAFISYALIIYPLLGLATGHVYPLSPTFGLPCPTTIFTFGILLFCDKRCPIIILTIPLLWSILGFSAVINFGVFEDAGLLVAGLVSSILILIRNKRLAAINTSLTTIS
jgi:hypothetical protein